MAHDPPDLVDLAAAVADGSPVDWRRVESEGASADERELVRGLRLLERVAEVHGGGSERPAGSDDAPAPVRPPDLTLGPEPVHWGSLRLLECIGRGAFGDVYRAWDSRLDREVALKLLSPRAAVTSATETLPVTSIVDEGRLLARVRHPGVVTVFGADRLDGRVGVWMELVAGRTLEEELRERGPLPGPEVLRIGIALADALAAVHRAGLIHRDVKAQNVMREPSGRLVLMDFGTGLEFADTADTTTLAGTPLYLAPELIEGGAVATPRSDVYGLGVLLYHLATARFPVEGRTLREIRRAHMRGERQALASRGTRLPRALVLAIDRALAPAPGDRYADATALVDALVTIERGRERRRRLGMAVAAGLGLVVATAGLVRFLSADRRDAGVTGLTWTAIPERIALEANIRGPAVDGRWVPCTSPYGSRNVALCNLQDGTVRVLREPARPGMGQLAGHSQISPDGRWLAYVWQGEPDLLTTTVNVIGLDGTGNREIHRASGTGFAAPDVRLEHWTADSLAVVVHDARQAAPRVLLAAVDGSTAREIWQLTLADVRVSLSPDERTLVIERRTAADNGDLVAIDLQTGTEAWRYASPSDDGSPIWLPDGRGVALVTNPQGCFQIARLSIDNGRHNGLPEALHDLGQQTAQLIGFGGSGALFVSVRNGASAVFTADVDLEAGTFGAAGQLPAPCADVTSGADWSPDGSLIAFVRSPSHRNGSTSVVVSTVDGRQVRQHDVPGVHDSKNRVRWAPDGNALAVSTWVPGAGGLLTVIDLVSGATRAVARTFAALGRICHPRWDGNDALCYRDGPIWRTSLSTGAREMVFRTAPGEAIQADAAFDIASDGTIVLGLAGPNESCTIRLRSPDGGERDRHTFPEPCMGMTWDREGSRLLVGTSHALWLLGRDSGEPRRLHADRRGFRDISLSPDERRLLFSLGVGPSQWARLNIPGLSAPAAVDLSLPARWQPLKTEPAEVTFKGRVTDTEGNPVPRVPVYAWHPVIAYGRTTWTSYGLPLRETDADGRYELPGRPPGEYVISVGTYILRQAILERRVPPPIEGPGGVRLAYQGFYRSPDGAADTPSLVRAEAGEMGGLDIRLERRPVFELQGEVITPAGVPQPGLVTAMRVVDESRNPPGGRSLPIINGRFHADDIFEGIYDLRVSVGPLHAEARVVVAGRNPEPVRLVLRPR
ncbi:MAG TPA: protein kinase [Vicinamibacterales bacterium]|nr:protein kinase [Vicinamibacterales bacterium]